MELMLYDSMDLFLGCSPGHCCDSSQNYICRATAHHALIIYCNATALLASATKAFEQSHAGFRCIALSSDKLTLGAVPAAVT